MFRCSHDDGNKLMAGLLTPSHTNVLIVINLMFYYYFQVIRISLLEFIFNMLAERVLVGMNDIPYIHTTKCMKIHFNYKII